MPTEASARPPLAASELFPDLASEELPCFLCGSEAVTVLHRGQGFAMGRCRGCGLIRQNPRLTGEALRAGHYDGAIQIREDARPARVGEAAWLPQPLEAYRSSVQAVVRARATAASLPPATAPWIDVGAAGGALLVAAREAGFPVLGVEVGAGQVRACRDLHGFEVFHGTLEEAEYPPRSAAVLSFRHVLEHLPDPLASLAEARRVLHPDGHLLIEVPNFGGLKYRGGEIRRKIHIGKNFWLSANVPEHLWYFTGRTLGSTLEKAGFELRSVATYGKTRLRRSPLRRLYDALRDGLRVGNKLRVVAAPRPVP